TGALTPVQVDASHQILIVSGNVTSVSATGGETIVASGNLSVVGSIASSGQDVTLVSGGNLNVAGSVNATVAGSASGNIALAGATINVTGDVDTSNTSGFAGGTIVAAAMDGSLAGGNFYSYSSGAGSKAGNIAVLASGSMQLNNVVAAGLNNGN